MSNIMQVSEAVRGLEAGRANVRAARLKFQAISSSSIENKEQKEEQMKMAAANLREAKSALPELEQTVTKMFNVTLNSPRLLSDGDFRVLFELAPSVGATAKVRTAFNHSTQQRWAEWKRAKRSRRHFQRQRRHQRRIAEIQADIDRRTEANARRKREKADRRLLHDA